MTWNDTASLNLNCGPPLSASERLPVDLEGHGHHRAGRLAVDVLPGVGKAADALDLGILEHAQ